MQIIERIKSFFGVKSEAKEPKTLKKKGVIRTFNHSRGFGFIDSPETTDRVFVHIGDMEKRCRVGDNVKFNIEETEKGLRARQVEII